LKVFVLSMLLLWQLGSERSTGGESQREFQSFHYERTVDLPSGATGQACAVLDGAVFAHAATSSARDMRLYARGVGTDTETPFILTESAPVPGDSQTAQIHNAELRDGALVFDLTMPPRAYTDVNLDLNATNFLGVAQVSGPNRTPLGTYTLFDLAAKGLSRSTTLALRESTFPDLHVELRLTTLDGHPLPQLSPAIVTGATVPPDRTGQTLFTTVASTSQMEQQGQWSLSTLSAPEHLPIERVLFVPDPKFTHDFLRQVTIAATPMVHGYDAVGAAESVTGQISRITRTAMPSGMPPIHSEQTAVDVALGSNLQSPAKIMASVHNGSDTPLPIQRVELQMRQRRICFEAAPDTSYLLRYGNPSLPVPVYPWARTFRPVASPIAAQLGPERVNAHFTPTAVATSVSKPNAKLLLILVLSVVAGVIAVQYTRYKHRETQ
jgi:hypothetical protein